MVSSGGEIRVYSDPSEENASSVTTTRVVGDGGDGTTMAVPGQLPATARTAWIGDSGSTVSRGTKESGVLALEAEERRGWLPADRETTTADCVGVTDAESSTFRTVLCVEAAIYEGGILSSPGSSPGGTPSSSSPSRQVTASSRPRRGVDDIPAVCSSPRRNESEALFGGKGSRHSSSPRTTSLSSAPPAAAAAPLEVRSSSPVLVGDMRVMCPAGPLAFFGTTDGGLGLDSVLGFTGTSGASEPFSTSSNGAGTRGGGDDLLGSVMNGGDTARTAASNAVGGGGVEKSARRSGFRHVLPGENWLTGSLRPSSSKRLPDSPPRQRDASSPESSLLVVDGVPVVPTAERSTTDSGTSVAESTVGASRSTLISSIPRSTAAPEVLDLRGKLGDGGSGAASAALTHPLFRLSLPGGVDPTSSPNLGLNNNPWSKGNNRLVSGMGTSSIASTSRTGTADATPVRRACLVRVSCKGRSSSSNSRNNAAVRGSSGSDGVGVKSLASLPPELCSPDLLASSEDGRIVAVGSHACDLVACFRLELHSSDASHTVANSNAVTKSSADSSAKGCTLGSTDGGPLGGGGGEATVDRSGARRRTRRQRRAVPLCTLRLPRGYRAKGITFVTERQRREELCGGQAGTNAMPGSSSSAAELAPADDRVTEEVLVLAGCAETDTGVVTDMATPSASKGNASLVGRPHRRDSSSSLEDTSYRTVLLRFSLPSGWSIGDGQDPASPTSTSASPEAAASGDASRGGRGVGCGEVSALSSVQHGSGNTRDSSGSNSSKNTSGVPRHIRPSSTALIGGSDVPGRGSHSTSTRVGVRGSSSSNAAEGDGGVNGGVVRLEAVLLEAVAGVEQRVNDRFSRLEGMLGGVCDRLVALEDAVRGQQATR